MVHRFNLSRRVVLYLIAAVVAYVSALWLLDPRIPISAQTCDTAMAQGAGYLLRHLDARGRFQYLVRLNGGVADQEEYNVLRHAGSIYSLALYHDLTGDPAARQAILRAAGYLLRQHVRPMPKQIATRAVFSFPGEEVTGTNAEVKLGGCGLGLGALVKARELDPDLVSLADLRELGKAILFFQEADGRFHSKCDESGRFIEGFEVPYYPGEAILGLALLHRIDPDPRWFNVALRGILYLQESRRNVRVRDLPDDHWLMLATAAILPACDTAQTAPGTRERLLHHSLQIGQMMMHEQRLESWVPGMNGSFTVDGDIPSSATRIEGLAALYLMLPVDHPERPRILRSIQWGLSFVLAGQVTNGSAQGGFRGAMWSWRFLPRATRLAHSEIRIDYVQHVLSALTGYHQVRTSLEATRPAPAGAMGTPAL